MFNHKILLITLLFIPIKSFGEYCVYTDNCSDASGSDLPIEANVNNCIGTDYAAYGKCYVPSNKPVIDSTTGLFYRITSASCISCKTGFTRISIGEGYTAEDMKKYVGPPGLQPFLCTQWDSSGNTLVDFATCECICDGDCTTINWRPITTEYEQMTEKNCVCDGQSAARCETTEHYRCAAGYYGQSTENTKPTCTKCPTLLRNDGVENPGTSSVGATSITNCYQPQNVEFTDNTGIYTFNGDNCYNTGN